MDAIYIGLAAFAGGILAAILGWLETQEDFVARKFAGSVARALVAGSVFAVGYAYSGSITIMDIFAAFVAGAGIDVIGNRAAGAIKSGFLKG